MTDLVLSVPLVFGKLTIEKLKFRDHVTAGDMLAFDNGGPIQQNIGLIANLTGHDEEVIKKLVRKDYSAAVAIVNKLFDDSSDETEKK